MADMARRIKLSQRALDLVSRQENPALWAELQNGLANGLARSPQGDRADNIEQAIIHYLEALKVYTENDFPIDWANTCSNLALAFTYRIKGNRADNIEQAIDCCKKSLNVYIEKKSPKSWASIHSNLGLIYPNRIQGNRSDNIEQSIYHCNQALKIYKKVDFFWALIQNNLAIAYTNRVEGVKANNIEQAIDHCNKALKAFTEKDFSEDWAMTQNNLANAYSERIRSDRAENIKQAIKHYEEALKVYTQKDFPILCQKTACNLGNLCLDVQRFSEAERAYTMGMEAAEELYRSSIFQASREVELAETRDLYRRAGYVLAKSNKLKEAALALERGRARGLGDALARDRADLEKVRKVDSRAYELYRQAVEELQNLESQERKGDSAEGKDLPPLRDLMMQARSRLDRALDRIRRIPGYESFLAEPGWEEIATAVVEGQPLVYIAAAPGGRGGPDRQPIWW